MENEIKRLLSVDEIKILEYIRELYGNQNSEKDVFISENDEAVIFVKNKHGAKKLCVVLTNVAEFSKKDNLTRDEICNQYLQIP